MTEFRQAKNMANENNRLMDVLFIASVDEIYLSQHKPEDQEIWSSVSIVGQLHL